MFFEVFEFEETKNHETSFLIYRTRTSKTQKVDSILSMKVPSIKYSPQPYLGYVCFCHDKKRRIVTQQSYFPFGGGSSIYGGADTTAHYLKGKGIAGALEFLLLKSIGSGFSVQQANIILEPRRIQLEKYGIKDCMPLYRYMKKISRSLSSPHFHIVQFPPWITEDQETEILQLSEKC